MKRIEVFGWVGVNEAGKLYRGTTEFHPQLRQNFPVVRARRKNLPSGWKPLKVRVIVEEAALPPKADKRKK